MPPPEELREMIWQVKVIIWIINIIVIIIIIVIVVIKSTISLSRCLAASGGQSRSVLNTTASQLQKYVTVTTITIAFVTTINCHQSPVFTITTTSTVITIISQVRLRQFEACISSGAVWDSLPITEKNTDSIEFEKLNEAVNNYF